jgi:hypothetical protein
MSSGYAEIKLRGDKAAGRIALVDQQDYELVSLYTWNVWEQEREGNTAGPYAITHIRRQDGTRTSVFMHTMVGRAMPGGDRWRVVDHVINGNTLDNRRSNLRDGTKGNTHNQRARKSTGKTSRYKGVHWAAQSNKWMARITFEGKTRYLGIFEQEDDAARAYNAAAMELFGEYALLNVVKG